jgi:hypothetical protein
MALPFVTDPETLNANTFSQTQPEGVIDTVQAETAPLFPTEPLVSELSDVSPEDWAYTAVQQLHEKYGCLAGYPDDTFRGEQAISRNEFAAALYTCLNSLTSITEPEILERLLSEFSEELEELEAQIDSLQSQQFSTTTRLFGQVVFGLAGRTSNNADFFPRDGVQERKDPGAGDIDLISSVDLTLLSRINRRGFLLIGIQAGEGSSFPSLTNDTRLSYEADTNSSLRLSELSYRHLITDTFAVSIGAAGISPASAFRGPNRVSSAGLGPVSAFAQRNPIINLGETGAGIGFDWQFAENASLQGVYAVSQEGSSDSSQGLFGSSYVFGSQIAFTPADPWDITFYYLHGYGTNGRLGTGVGDDLVVALTGADSPLSTNALGATFNWFVHPGLTAGGWAGYTHSTVPNVLGSVETFNWMLFLNFPNLFSEGNLGGIYIGQPPRIISSNLSNNLNIPGIFKDFSGSPGGQSGVTTHVEVFYRAQITENIWLTPGIILISEPGNSSASDSILVGTLRTTFRF